MVAQPTLRSGTRKKQYRRLVITILHISIRFLEVLLLVRAQHCHLLLLFLLCKQLSPFLPLLVPEVLDSLLLGLLIKLSMLEDSLG